MADTTDVIYEERKPEPHPNHTGRAAKVFAIHMGVLLVVSLLIGIFGDMGAMWVFGGLSTFFMVGFHLGPLYRAVEKDREWKFDNFD